MKHIPFPKISNRPDIIMSSLNHEHGEPSAWAGAVKLHGTNAAIGCAPCDDTWEDYTMWFQSRNRIIKPDDDNAGFAMAMSHKVGVSFMMSLLADTYAQPVLLYGEWVGPGVQSSVAIAQLPEKTFYPFALYLVDEKRFVAVPCLESVFFDPFFSTRQTVPVGPGMVAKMQKLTDAADTQCPVGKSLGLEGHGEGYVWAPVGEHQYNPEYWFKTKGTSHSTSAKKTKIKQPSVPLTSEHLEWVQEHVAKRMRQAEEYVIEMDGQCSKASTGKVIGWILADIHAEEDIPQGLDLKSLGKTIAEAFHNYLEQV